MDNRRTKYRPSALARAGAALFIVAAAAAAVAAAEDPPAAAGLGPVVWATPEWEGLTGPGGTGLYHDVVKAAFGCFGLDVEVRYRPYVRSMLEAEAGKADFSGADSAAAAAKYALAAVPVYVNVTAVFYSRAAVPSYRGPADLEGRTGIWPLGYVDNMPPHIRSVLSGSGVPDPKIALRMVLHGRCDYYIDDRPMLFRVLESSEEPYDPSAFAKDVFYTENLFFCFTKNERGRKLADLFDRGMRRLRSSGELARIYAAWGHPVPVF